MTINYIETVQAAYNLHLKEKGSKLNMLVSRIGDLIEEMEQRQSIALDENLTKLTKIKRITSWKTYEMDASFSFDGEIMAPLNTLALKHTIHLINGLLKFDNVSKKVIAPSESIVTYHRTVDSFTALMQIRKDGFHLIIGNGENTVFDRIVGGTKIRHSFSWVKVMDELRKSDFGIFRMNRGLASDIFEAHYKVKESNIEAIKARLRKEFVANGFMTRERMGHGLTVGNATLGSRSQVTLKDVINIRRMVHGDTVWEIKEAMRIANAVLKSEGYTEKYER
jgi:hypothetical protein